MNIIEIQFRKRLVLAEPDKRYRILISLQRADRPRRWNFQCFNCGSKQFDIMNYEVHQITDFYDPENINNSGIGRHCKGTLPDGLPCPYTYFFNLQ